MGVAEISALNDAMVNNIFVFCLFEKKKHKKNDDLSKSIFSTRISVLHHVKLITTFSNQD